MGHARQVARQHDGAANVVGRQAGRAGHRLDHDPLERALAELAGHEPEEELPLVVAEPREQLAQEPPLRLGGTLAGRAGDSLRASRPARRARRGSGALRPLGRDRRGGRRGLKRPAHPTPSFSWRNDAAEVDGGELDLVGRRGGEQVGEAGDLVAPPAGGGDAAGGVDELGELQWRDPARGRGIIAEQAAVRVVTRRRVG